jgi:transcriptional regulator with XRE-family HTH domain
MLSFDEKAIIRRIIEVRKAFAGARGKSKFADALGVSFSAYTHYEDDRLPPVPALLKICEVGGADLRWLLTGQCEAAQSRQGGAGLNAKLMEKLTGLLQTSPESADALIAFIELLSEKKNVERKLASKIPEPRPERPGWIPILGRTAAGMVHFWRETGLPKPKDAIVELDHLVEKYTGRAVMASSSGVLSLDLQIWPLARELKTRSANLIQVSGQTSEYGTDEIVEFVECQEIHELFPDAFALQIDGESMSPRINDADIVILSPSVPAARGHIAVAKLADQIGVTCKLIRTVEGQIHLIPINEKYETETVPTENLAWALAVLCHVRISH